MALLELLVQLSGVAASLHSAAEAADLRELAAFVEGVIAARASGQGE